MISLSIIGLQTGTLSFARLFYQVRALLFFDLKARGPDI